MVEESARQRYRELVAYFGREEDIAPDQLNEILEAAGKTDDELESDVQTYKRRAALNAELEALGIAELLGEVVKELKQIRGILAKLQPCESAPK